MRIKFLIAFFFFFCSRMMQVSARDRIVDTLQSNVILGRYLEKLNRIHNKYQHVPDSVEIPVGYSPYYYKILSPALLYRAALRQHFLVRHEFSDSLDCTDPLIVFLLSVSSVLPLFWPGRGPGRRRSHPWVSYRRMSRLSWIMKLSW